jgi:polysaccharide biosynthesis/export protein
MTSNWEMTLLISRSVSLLITRPVSLLGALHRSSTGLIMVLLLLSVALRFPAISAESHGPVKAYRFAPGDRITINVFGHTDLSGEFAVDVAGNVSLPLVGAITIGGLTVQESEQEIIRRLSDGYIRHPGVSVRINELTPIYVLGDVKTPGGYPFRYGAAVLNAIAMAGGVAVMEQSQGAVIAEFLLADERVRILESSRRASIIRRTRLEAQRDSVPNFEISDLLAEYHGDKYVTSVIVSERELFDLHLQMLNKELDLLRQQKPRLKAEIEAVQQQARAENKQLELIRARLQEYKTLQSKGLGISSTGIELEREHARNLGNLSRYEAEIWRLELSLGEIDIKMQEVRNNFTRRVMGELQETRAKLQELDATLPTAREIRELKLQQTGGAAGIDTERPQLKIVITRSRGEQATTLNATEATLLEPGDIIEVRKLQLRRQMVPIAHSELGNDPTHSSTNAAASSTSNVSH